MTDEALIAPDDAFLGTWVLDASQSNYTFGQPPKSGTYRIRTQGNHYHMDIAWTDQTDQAFDVSYEAIPDGLEYPYEDPAVADRVSMTRVDARTLDSASFQGRQRIAYARRVLSEDGRTMTIRQSGSDRHGQQYTNLAVYAKQD
ncbi:MAG: hypothetical protein K8J31_18180 [Anaerolineae bacterium]|nr:hypothetical protein [Anaerolineae bacterium]